MASVERPPISVLINTVTDLAEQIIKKITLDTRANLVAQPQEGGTPVDTGHARANWVASIGAPVEEEQGTRPERLLGKLSHPVSTEAAERGIAEVATQYKLEKGRVFISNNVPYILALNEGHSQQAPAGFVQLAIAKAIEEDLAKEYELTQELLKGGNGSRGGG